MRLSINSGFNQETLRNVPLVLISGTAATSPIAREIGELVRFAQSHREITLYNENGDPVIGADGCAITETRQIHHLWVCSTLVDYVRCSRSQALGRWLFEGNLDSLSAADRKSLDYLLKHPSRFGTVILYSEDYFKRRDVSSIILKAKEMHEINVSYPSRRYLVTRFIKFTDKLGLDVSQGVAEYCVDRLGIRYGEYFRYIESFIPHLSPPVNGERPEISKDAARECLKGVDGLTIDDFMERLAKPLAKDTFSPNTKLYKAYRAALDTYGARRFLSMVLYRVKQYLVLRSLIDEGLLPVGIEYTAAGVYKRVGEPPEQLPKGFSRYSILNWGDYKLRKETELAGATILADWLWLKMCLSKPCVSDEDAETLLITAMTRSRLESDVLNAFVN